jgi:protein O-GlcNAc transferase
MLPIWHQELQGVKLAAAQRNDLLLEVCSQALLRGHGNQPDAVLDLAASLLQAGELHHSEALLLWCHQLKPHDPKPLRTLATIWLQTLRQPEALALYELLPPSVHHLMALAYQPGRSAHASRQLAEAWAQHQAPTAPSPTTPPEQGALRLGFLSADLCQHPVGLFLWPLVEELAQSHQVQLFFYDNSPRSDWLTQHLQACGHWRLVHQLSDQQLADRVREDAVTVLIDLSGHTGGSRLTVLQHRPAPLQLSWLGYWATTGSAAAVDAVIADPLVVPLRSPEAASFVEPVVRLPHGRWCYRPVPWMPDPGPPPCLERGWVTFGCFNTSSKLNEPLLRCWLRLLHTVPESRLFLKNYQLKDQQLQGQLRSWFVRQGVAPERLQLEGPSVHAELLATYSQVDIALDPFPFNGGLTSCEALWLGVPLVTLAGHDQAAVMASRQGLALLQQLGRSEWIASSQERYVAIAAALASEPDTLASLRQSQRHRMQQSSLCDSKAFALHFLQLIRELLHLRLTSVSLGSIHQV